MATRDDRRIFSAVAAVILLLGVPAVTSGRTQERDGQRPIADPQAIPASGDRGWSGITTEDRSKRSAPPRVEYRPPKHATDVPGQPVVAPVESAGPIVTPARPSKADIDAIRDAIAAHGTARVNVTTRIPVGLAADSSAADSARHHSQIDGSLDQLQDRLGRTGSRELGRIEVYPWATYTITSAGLDALLADPSVTSFRLDGFVQPALDTSTAIVDSDLLNAAGILGNGWEGSPDTPYEVVIIDSGVDNDHDAFIGRVVAEACFSADADCPGGVTSSTGPNTGENCTFAASCDHGTHVASIAAGGAYTGGHEGVARGAQIVPIAVASSSGGTWVAYFSDINQALQFALNRRNAGEDVVAVNMSIGIDGYATNTNCDNVNADFAATQAVAANLQNAGVAVVAAAGNSNLTGVSYPACLSSVYAVSATNDSDTPAGFTNSGTLTDWWAPGVSIDAAVPGTNTHGFKDGTSMSSPHVAGAFALLRECVDGNGVPITNGTAVSRLNNSGVNVTDNGATRRRINVLDAATGLVNNNDFASPETLPSDPGAGFNDFDFNICSDTEPGEPGPFSLDNGIWWTWTPSATGNATISTEDGGGNVTTFDTTLAVYTGSTLGSLTLVASDDDSGTDLRSLVTFPVNAGTTLRIKVDGFGAQTGLLNLHVQIDPIPCGGLNATIVGTSGNDVIAGTAANDVIVAGPGDDRVNAGGGHDTVCGDEGDDTIKLGGGDDFALGGSGADDIAGLIGNDTLVGNPGGGSTDDVGDLLDGGPGQDYLDGWVGHDTLIGGPGPDNIRGEAGIDTVDYSTAPAAVTVDLSAGSASGGAGNDTLVKVENIIATAYHDYLKGNGAANVIAGRDGRDTILGEAGDDSVRGMDGNDTVRGGSDDDTVLGDAGNDDLFGDGGTDTCNGGTGTDTAAPSCETTIAIP